MIDPLQKQLAEIIEAFYTSYENDCAYFPQLLLNGEINYDKKIELSERLWDKRMAEAVSDITALVRKAEPSNSKVDRFEVIGDTGRVYAKGAIYGTPVSVELQYQDDGRTLKVFVRPMQQEQDTHETEETA